MREREEGEEGSMRRERAGRKDILGGMGEG